MSLLLYRSQGPLDKVWSLLNCQNKSCPTHPSLSFYVTSILSFLTAWDKDLIKRDEVKSLHKIQFFLDIFQKMTYNRKVLKTIFDRKRMNMSQYSRSNKNQKPEDTTDSRPSRGEKVKQGLSVFQTVVATIASLLGIIVTSFTIISLLNKDNQKTEDKPSSSTSVVVVHDKGSDSSATNTDANTNTQTDSSNTDASSQKETDSSSATETSSSAVQDQGSTATDSGADTASSGSN